MTFNDINEIEMIKFIDYLKNNTEAKDVSINTYMRAMRAILNKFSNDFDYMPKIKVVVPSYNETFIEPYKPYEIKEMTKKPPKKKGFLEYRNWVMVCFVYDTLSRLANLTTLKIKDVDFENNIIIFRNSKGKKLHIIPLSSTLSPILLEYLHYRNGKEEDYIFCKEDGNPLSKDGIRNAILRYNKKRGIETTGIHRIRHTGAKDLCADGVSDFIVQQMLGHTTLHMTARYAKMYGNKAKSILDQHSPLTNTGNFNKADILNRN